MRRTASAPGGRRRHGGAAAQGAGVPRSDVGRGSGRSTPLAPASTRPSLDRGAAAGVLAAVASRPTSGWATATMYAVEAVLSLSQFRLVLRHGSVPLRPGSPVRSGRPPGRCQTGSGLHCPDLTAGTPVHARRARARGPRRGRGAGRAAAERSRGGGDPRGRRGRQRSRRARRPHRGGARGWLQRGDRRGAVPLLLRPADARRAGDDQAVDMAGRLGLARVQGVDDERLARMAARARPCPTAAGRGRRPTSGSCSAPPTAVRRHGRRNPSAR